MVPKTRDPDVFYRICGVLAVKCALKIELDVQNALNYAHLPTNMTLLGVSGRMEI